MSFRLQFDGNCQTCGIRMHVGDEAGYIDGCLSCSTCLRGVEGDKRAKTCPECGLLHRGEC